MRASPTACADPWLPDAARRHSGSGLAKPSALSAYRAGISSSVLAFDASNQLRCPARTRRFDGDVAFDAFTRESQHG